MEEKWFGPEDDSNSGKDKNKGKRGRFLEQYDDENTDGEEEDKSGFTQDRGGCYWSWWLYGIQDALVLSLLVTASVKIGRRKSIRRLCVILMR